MSPLCPPRLIYSRLREPQLRDREWRGGDTALSPGSEDKGNTWDPHAFQSPPSPAVQLPGRLELC